MRRVKFVLLLGGIGIFYLSVTLLALTMGLFAEACRETSHWLQRHLRRLRA